MSDAAAWNTKIIEEPRIDEGRIGGQFGGAPAFSRPALAR